MLHLCAATNNSAHGPIGGSQRALTLLSHVKPTLDAFSVVNGVFILCHSQRRCDIRYQPTRVHMEPWRCSLTAVAEKVRRAVSALGDRFELVQSPELYECAKSEFHLFRTRGSAQRSGDGRDLRCECGGLHHGLLFPARSSGESPSQDVVPSRVRENI
jgi:hypothetical protein